MARDTVDAVPIENRDQLYAWFEKGSKPKDRWRIGTEHEKFGFHTDDLSPVAYEGPRGVRKLLEGMEGLLGWEPIMDRDAIIGLADPVGGGAISLEPGGQFELSGAPLETLHHTCRETFSHLAQVREIGDPLGIGFLGVGASPKWSRAETPVMPKSRYGIMSAYMPKVGGKGLDMMFRTSTVQVNLDYGSEADMRNKMRVSLALQPVATALFASSPFLDGKPNGFLSYRSEVWRDTDAARTGMLPIAFEDGFGFEAYAEWALDVPMYLIKREDTYHDATDVTFRQFLEGALRNRLPGVVPEIGDWVNHLGSLFPEVRLKRYIEQRGADAGPWRRLLALPAFWVGLLYDEGVLDEALALVADWSAEERQYLRDAAPRLALKTPFRSGTLLDVAREAVALSRKGLARRNRLGPCAPVDISENETVYLAPLEEIVATGETLAERMLRQYEKDWNGDVNQVFAEYAY
ncbi:glutamate--cysteine ligase [Prosthecodimorpha staleyi]|uniref:Glutamate--cysteine ligase n=1 Tax=Prosthecodimorpha staleyi TaxID=2840188 RepID=A0A947GCN5_9HYPH|nr:glutamate--cysteine ligase [Prosthecodimorpha staleyi]MBT9289386.1 glutamate--cysteine ligase [Prosthecodimorpha staleyi]